TVRRVVRELTLRLWRAIAQPPRERRARARSGPETTIERLKRRVLFVGFFSGMWRKYARLRTFLPLPVRRSRFAAARWVFIFGIALLPFGFLALHYRPLRLP